VVRPDDGGGDFSGIDPQKLWDLINSIKNRTGDDGSAQPQVNNWMGQATRIGLDTTQLSTINRHFSWAQDQLPMLRRRHSLAVDEAKEDMQFGSGSGMVGAGAGSLGNFKTSEDAQKAAQNDAKLWQDGKLSAQAPTSVGNASRRATTGTARKSGPPWPQTQRQRRSSCTTTWRSSRTG
jgi:hypothetical protein